MKTINDMGLIMVLLKDIVKKHVSVSKDNQEVNVSLELVVENDWKSERKSEYKTKIYAIENEDELFLEVKIGRSGDYHSEYTYSKPTFNLVEKTVKNKISYPIIQSTPEEIECLKSKYFDKYDSTDLKPIYDSENWQREGKSSHFESVYNINGVLFKQTLFGNEDWTEFVDYDIVERKEELVTSFKKIPQPKKVLKP